VDILRRTLLGFGILAWTAAACASILGIEEKPVRREIADVESPSDAGAPDAACIETPSSGCACAHDFCDDFDAIDADVGRRWVSALTPAGGPFSRSRAEGGITTVRGGEGVSPPHTFETRVFTEDNNAYAFLFHRLAHVRGPTFQGVRFRFLTRIKELDVTDDGGTSPIPGGGILVGGLLTESIPPKGIVLGISARGVYLAAADDDVFNTRDASIAPVYEGDVLRLAKLVFTIDLFVVTRERALADKLEPCEAVMAPAVAAIRVGGLASACMPLPQSLTGLEWTTESVAILGAAVVGEGTTHLLHDNAMVDFLE
jgi:hypothetical protein